MEKSVFLASASLIALLAAPSAFAADITPILYKESQRLPWAGGYLGLNGGYAWAADPRTDCVFVDPISPCRTTTFPTVKPEGAEFGVQAGYNWRVANWVFGIESDINYLGAQRTAQFPGVDTGKGPDQLSSRYDWLGTTRGRVGVVTGPAMLYATGGLAYGRVSHEYDFGLGSPSNTQFFASSGNQVGWTAGGGAEYDLGRNWSVKAEYLYVHLAGSSLDISALRALGVNGSPPGTTVLHFNNNLNIMRVGANYHF
jgi:outer membrane immunogenic protein